MGLGEKDPNSAPENPNDDESPPPIQQAPLADVPNVLFQQSDSSAVNVYDLVQPGQSNFQTVNNPGSLLLHHAVQLGQVQSTQEVKPDQLTKSREKSDNCNCVTPCQTCCQNCICKGNESNVSCCVCKAQEGIEICSDDCCKCCVACNCVSNRGVKKQSEEPKPKRIAQPIVIRL